MVLRSAVSSRVGGPGCPGPGRLLGERDVVVVLSADPGGGVAVGVGEGLLVALGGEAGLVAGEELGECGVDLVAGPGDVLVRVDAVADGAQGHPVAGVAGLGAVGPDGSDGGGEFRGVVHAPIISMRVANPQPISAG